MLSPFAQSSSSAEVDKKYTNDINDDVNDDNHNDDNDDKHGNKASNDDDDDEDPLSTLLDLESTFYAQGYASGLDDGHRAGLIEGRLFGLEAGFTKFQRMGRLHGRATVLAARTGRGAEAEATAGAIAEAKAEAADAVQVRDVLPTSSPGSGSDSGPESASASATLVLQALRSGMLALNPLPPPGPRGNMARLQKHVRTLQALTQPESLGLTNSEDDVGEFEERYKRAVARAGIVGRMIGEGGWAVEAGGGVGGEMAVGAEGRSGMVGRGGSGGGRDGEAIEDIDLSKVRR